MRNTLAALAVVLGATSAVAADLPGKSAPAAPAPIFTSKAFYAGVNAGGVVTDGFNTDAPWTIGVVGGYNVVSLGPIGVAAEGTYDYKKGGTNDVAGNVVGGYKFGSFTPYALVGVGYRWADIKNEAIWNVGGGVKYSLSSTLDIDGRYRRVDNFDRNSAEDRVSVGVNYKF